MSLGSPNPSPHTLDTNQTWQDDLCRHENKPDSIFLWEFSKWHTPISSLSGITLKATEPTDHLFCPKIKPNHSARADCFIKEEKSRHKITSSRQSTNTHQIIPASKMPFKQTCLHLISRGKKKSCLSTTSSTPLTFITTDTCRTRLVKSTRKWELKRTVNILGKKFDLCVFFTAHPLLWKLKRWRALSKDRS